MSALIVNLFGAPGSGKSTGAAYLFSCLKLLGYNAELVTEFAKDKTWEKNETALAAQDYVTAQQHYRIRRCVHQTDVVITDSPILLGLIYANPNEPEGGSAYRKYLTDVFSRYNNYNCFVVREKPYNPTGRTQTKQESDAIALRITDLLKETNTPFQYILGNKEGYESVLQDIISLIDRKEA